MKPIVCLLLFLSTALVHAAPDYQKDLVPVLREYCAGCHNEDDYDGDFSVETFAAMMEGGEKGDVIAPGDADASRLMKFLRGETRRPMPPKDEPQLTAAQVDLFQAWIDAGATGPQVDESILMAKLEVPDIAPQSKRRGPVTAAEFSPDGTRLALADYTTVRIQDAATGKEVSLLTDHPGKVNAVHFSPDGTRLLAASGVTGASGVAILWDLRSGERLREFSGHRDVLYDAEFSPDGSHIATAGYDRKIRIWEAKSGAEIHTIEIHNGAIFDLAFSPDGQVLASASADETVKLWQVETGKRLDTLNQPEAEQYSVTFSPDGRFILAAGADNRIRQWRFISKTQAKINPLVRARFAHEGAVVRLAISSDGRQLVSAADDRSLKLWSLPELNLASNFETQPEVASVLAMRPDDSQILAARLDGSLERYPLQTQTEEATAQAKWQAPDYSNAALKDAVAVKEAEPNDQLAQAKLLQLPAKITGAMGEEGDVDLYRFDSKAGQEWVVEVNAERSKSLLDSRIEILDESGEPVPWALLQAVRDSWINFRGIDSDVSDGLRLQNWEEMELNEYFYFNGEVVKFWLYPRGPDSGFKMYPGFGKRYTYFGTTALAHPVNEPGYIVRALPPDATPKPNGLPTFTMYYANDDDPQRRRGSDSYLIFTAPKDGNYIVRVSDVRGFGGEKFDYTLDVRPTRPDFEIKIEEANPKVNLGSGKEFTLRVERKDGFEGEIEVGVKNLPEGFIASTPIIVQEGQDFAQAVIYALPDAPQPTEEAAKASQLIAKATIRGKEVTKNVGSLGKIELLEAPKMYVEIHPTEGEAEPGQPVEFTVAPGETITGRVVVRRNGSKSLASFGKEDAGRNFPHGVYVDNIGLNGLLIPAEDTERTFFITAANWVPDTTRFVHLKVAQDGKQTSLPAIIHVRSK